MTLLLGVLLRISATMFIMEIAQQFFFLFLFFEVSLFGFDIRVILAS